MPESDVSESAGIVLETLPADKYEIAEKIDLTTSSARDKIRELREAGYDIEYDRSVEKYHRVGETPYNTAKDIDPEKVKEEIKTGAQASELVEEFNTIPTEVASLVESLRNDGVNINTTGEKSDPIYHIPTEWDRQFELPTTNNTLRIALISDTHLGSKTEHLDELHDFYNRCVNAGITDVFHCGDISDGWDVHPGHLNEIKDEAAGWGRLEDYVVENYPQRDSITTHFIEGNHDNKFFNRNNIHFGKLLAKQRPDLNYLGNSQATVYLDRDNDISLELIHPSGGKPYTTGYRLQTLFRERNMSERPTIAGVGHIHGSMFAETEGVKGLYAGAWKGTTTYGKRKGFQAKIGGWILEITISDGEITEFVPRWQGYSENKSKNDYELETLD